MKWSWFGRAAMALTSAVALGLSMTACGGGTIAYIWAVGNTAPVSSGSASGTSTNGQIVGYRVDHYTGNLTATPNQPFSTNGSNPVDILVRPGGRFVYVIDQGTGYTNGSAGTSANIAVYAVGGTGSLTFEQSYESQGYGHLWAQFDSTGGYLFILDKYSPSGDGNGAITTFASDPTTGRLNLQTQTASAQPNQTPPTYLEVGRNPLRMFSTGSCLYTVNSATQTISTFSIASGQLNTVTTGTFPPGTINITSINGNTQYVILTDNENNPNLAGRLFVYTVGGGCALTSLTGGPVPNSATAADPVNTIITGSGTNTYIYVLNSSSTNTNGITRGSTLSAFGVSAGTLTELRNSPFSAGGAPSCIVVDPTNEYLYTSDGDGTITGYDYAPTNGQLNDLARGSKFVTTATGGLSCLAISGYV